MDIEIAKTRVLNLPKISLKIILRLWFSLAEHKVTKSKQK